ncbi:uncharacterized protein LOC120528877 [Polypterus senegalus]|uniref:uncharacterized protein LOC120528877 n=1 Tax=Polypterus senegalus TaxID=55291 RepID=UPI001962EA58|nr:uncharacterized protein LOC120528877 [Polypterus senegalus]
MAEEHNYATVSFAPKQMELTEMESSEPKEPNGEITYAEVKFAKPLNHQEKDFQMVQREEVIYAEVKYTNLQQKNSSSQTASDINKDNADTHCRTEWKTPGDEKQSNGDTTKVQSTNDKQMFSPLKLLLILLFSLLLAVGSSLGVYCEFKYKSMQFPLTNTGSRIGHTDELSDFKHGKDSHETAPSAAPPTLFYLLKYFGLSVQRLVELQLSELGKKCQIKLSLTPGELCEAGLTEILRAKDEEALKAVIRALNDVCSVSSVKKTSLKIRTFEAPSLPHF